MEIKYIYDIAVHNTNAAEHIVPLFIENFRPKSVVDVGCGTGTWLRVFKNFGIEDFLGIDGENVVKNLLMIDDKNFISANLSHPFSLKRKFDLVLSLEVAEHLPEKSADIFIKTLTDLSNTIVFSAAIPGQGGQNHLNEQYPDYWKAKFVKFGYEMIDNYSQKFWNNNKIEWWYKQNMFIYKKQNATNRSKELNLYIHPELYKKKLEEIRYLNLEKMNIYKGRLSVIQGFKIFCKSLLYSVGRKK